MKARIGFYLFSLIGLYSLVSYTVLTAAFLAAHYLIHIAPISGAQVSASMFIHLIPHITLYSLPIALCLAVGLTLNRLYLHGEYRLLLFFTSVRRLFYGVTATSILLFGSVFIPCSLYWAPTQYVAAKKTLLASLVDMIQGLEPHVMHQLPNGMALMGSSFELLSDEENKRAVVASDVVLSLSPEQLVHAQSAVIENGVFRLLDGTIVQASGINHADHRFSELVISYDVEGKNFTAPKYQTIDQLLKRDDFKSLNELHKRIIQIFWQFFLPLLLLLLLPRHGLQHESKIVLIALYTTGLFVLFYALSMLIAGEVHGVLPVMSAALVVPVTAVVLLYLRTKKSRVTSL